MVTPSTSRCDATTVVPPPIKPKLLVDCFHSIASGVEPSFRLEILEQILSKELNVCLDKLDSHLRQILPYLLVHFMRTWPRWHIIREGLPSDELLLLENWCSFLSEQISAVIGENYDKAIEQLIRITGGTTLEAANAFAPYTLNIQCPARMLNTIFLLEDNDNIILKEHRVRPWQNLNYTQLIHWPHISIHFQTPDLVFRRSMATDYKRFLNCVPFRVGIPDAKKPIVERIEPVAEMEAATIERKSFTVRYLEEYISNYKCLLHANRSVSKTQLEEIDILLWHLVADAKRIDINKSIATNSRILFRLGNRDYVRVKRMNKAYSTEQSLFGLCELQCPKVELDFCEFRDTLDPDTDFVTFTSLRRATEANTTNEFVPNITYSCRYCNCSYSEAQTGRDLILQHFMEVHTMESPVRCTTCKKPFQIVDLASNRWSHDCDGRAVGGQSSAKTST